MRPHVPHVHAGLPADGCCFCSGTSRCLPVCLQSRTWRKWSTSARLPLAPYELHVGLGYSLVSAVPAGPILCQSWCLSWVHVACYIKGLRPQSLALLGGTHVLQGLWKGFA